ncbi:adenylate/guanylate cyclase domain-containing protein [Ruegeria atlantica]|uniref:adenylate/guanylate cyclase domain-containing protein n=1 Tax=Ruegeria atlantica TaxID=81569 RepID=UPI00147B3E3B|nr:adenylate/guanylate cyclase domain-containing protein [Ruegeria atlantica]
MSIAEWLRELGLDRYIAVFEENAIDIDTLPELTDADLASIGVLLGHRKKILKAVNVAAATAVEVTLDRAGAAIGQRRQVTVLFADLTGYTRLSARLDPEEAHKLLNNYFAAVDAVVENYAGRVDKHIGDCVMAVFGAPIAHSDDPERALRAASEIHDAMRDLSDRLGLNLSAHIGIASGQVVASRTGSEQHIEYTVTGNTVNLASRLDDIAAPEETLVSEAVYRATSQIANFASRGEASVQGLDAAVPIWAFECFRESEQTDYATPFVGRAAELRQLTSITECVRADGSGHIVLLRGEAGIGKTRLSEEYIGIAGAQGFATHRVHIVDFGAARGPRVLRDLASTLLGLPLHTDEAERRKVLGQILVEGSIAAENLVFLIDLLDLPQPDYLQRIYSKMPSDERLVGIGVALGALIAAQAARAPRLIVMEDVHWAEQATIDVLSGLAANLSYCPAILMLTSRTEGWILSPDFARFFRGCPITSIELQRLHEADAVQLAEALAYRPAIDLGLLVERADGNPLFLEQMMRNLSHVQSTVLPGTIHGLVLARIDRLPARDREAIMAASVLGNRFDLSALRDLIGKPAYECETLIRHRLIRLEGEEHLFAHALIREGVNASILRDMRRELHLRAAEHYRARDLILHAQHLDCAESPEAPAAALAAAQDQATRVRYETAMQLAVRGSELSTGPEQYDLQMLLGDLSRRLGKTDQMIEAYRAAHDAADSGAERSRALIGVGEAQRIAEAYDDVLDTLSNALREADDAPLLNERARICQLKAGVHFVRGDTAAGLAENRRSLDLARQAGSRELEAQAQGNLGDAEFAAARMISAHARFDDCVSLGREHGLDDAIAANLAMRGQTLLYLCRTEDALADCEEALQLARSHFNPRAEVVALLVGIYTLELFDIAATRDWALSTIDAAKRIGSVNFENVGLEYLGRATALQGDHAKAERLVVSAVDAFRQSESSMRFLGGRALGSLALVTRDGDRQREILAEGEELVAQGVGAHNPLWFYRDAIEVSLDLGDWDEADRYAEQLEIYTSGEPLPWSRFFCERGRALARDGRGEDVKARLWAIRTEALTIGFTHAVARIDASL